MSAGAARRLRLLARCAAGHVTVGDFVDQVGGMVLSCGCGRPAYAQVLEVVVRPDHTCGARCTSATGGRCSCSCGGENHGADHRYRAPQA